MYSIYTVDDKGTVSCDYSDEKDAKILNELLTNCLAVCQCESAELGWPFCKLT